VLRAEVMLHVGNDVFAGKHVFRRCLETDGFTRLVNVGELSEDDTRNHTKPSDFKKTVACPVRAILCGRHLQSQMFWPPPYDHKYSDHVVQAQSAGCWVGGAPLSNSLCRFLQFYNGIRRGTGAFESIVISFHSVSQRHERERIEQMLSLQR
jgi:hypothetical protein